DGEEDMGAPFTEPDGSGKAHVWSHSYHVVVPRCAVPAAGEQTRNGPPEAVAPTPPAVLDACGNTITPTPGTAPTPSACEEDMVCTVEYTYGLGSGEKRVHRYQIEMTDFTMPADVEQTVNCPAEAVAPTRPTVLDACGNTITPTPGTAATPSAFEEDTDYTFTYAVCYGNEHVWTHTLHIVLPDYTMLSD